MPRRQRPPLNGAPYCGNKLTREVHNLDNEKPQCNIDGIIRMQNAVPYHSLLLAEIDEFRNCEHCMKNAVENGGQRLTCNSEN